MRTFVILVALGLGLTTGSILQTAAAQETGWFSFEYRCRTLPKSPVYKLVINDYSFAVTKTRRPDPETKVEGKLSSDELKALMTALDSLKTASKGKGGKYAAGRCFVRARNQGVSLKTGQDPMKPWPDAMELIDWIKTLHRDRSELRAMRPVFPGDGS